MRTVGNPHRAQISRFELRELTLSFRLDKRFPVERFEAAVSQSTVPSPPHIYIYIYMYLFIIIIIIVTINVLPLLLLLLLLVLLLLLLPSPLLVSEGRKFSRAENQGWRSRASKIIKT